jgi:flagellar motor component MotA
MVAIALGLALASALLLGAVLLREAFPLALANAGAVLVVVVALCAQVVLVDLRRTVRIPVLELLKLEREFE